MEPDNLFNLLESWVAHGWIRALDNAFAGFLSDLAPESSESVLLAAALASHQLGRGHICLDLSAALANPDAILSLPPEGETGEAMPDKPSEVLAGITLAAWEKSLKESELVVDGGGNTPLVLDSGRLYLRRYWQYEQQVANGILQRLDKGLPVPDDLSERLDKLFEKLRSPGEHDKSEVHWQSVAAAVAARGAFSVISGGPGTGKTTTVVRLLGLLQGLALSGERKLRIRLAAPTGKAAARLTESIGDAVDQLPEDVRKEVPTEVTTLHRLLGSRPDTRNFVHNEGNPLHVDLLVVDEASMIDLEMMTALLSALPRGARMILLGDKDQLASVEAGAVLGDLCRNAEKGDYRPDTVAMVKGSTGYSLDAYAGDGSPLDQHIVVLRKSHRFGENSGIGALARAVNAGDPKAVDGVWKRGYGDIARLTLSTTGDESFARLVLDGGGSDGREVGRDGSDCGEAGTFHKDQKGGGPLGYRAYLALVKAGARAHGCEESWFTAVLDAFGRFQILAALRKGDWGVEGLNVKVAQILCAAGLIRAKEGWYSGRPVLVTRNDYSLGLMNGDIGIALPAASETYPGRKSLRVVFPMAGGELKKVLPSRLNDVETVYAMTVHKSQGSEFEHTAMVLPDRMGPVLTRELVYTGITRARSWFTLATPRMDLLAQSVTRRTHRASGLGDLF